VSSIDWYSPAEILEEAKLGTLQIAPPQFLDLLRISSHKDYSALSSFCTQRHTVHDTSQLLIVLCAFKCGARGGICANDSFYKEALAIQLLDTSTPAVIDETVHDNMARQTNISRVLRQDDKLSFLSNNSWDGHTVAPFEDMPNILRI